MTFATRFFNIISDLKKKENLNVLIYLGSSLFSALAGLIMVRFYTKYLGPEDFGIFGYVTTVNAFLIPLFTLNLNSFYIKKIYQQAEKDDSKELLGTIVLSMMLWTISLTVVLTLLGSLAFSALQIKVAFYPYMFLTLLSNVFIGFTTMIILQYRILSKAWMYFMVNALQTVLLLGIGYVFVGIIQEGIYGRIYGILIGSLVTGIISIVLLLPHIKWRINKKILTEGLRFSLPLVPYSLAILLFDTLDRFFLERYSVSMANTGIYNMGAQFALIISMLSLAFYKSYEPVIFKMIANGEDKNVAKTILSLNNIMLGVSVLFILLAGSIINYLTHNKFRESVIIAVLLVVAFYFKSAYVLLNTILAAHSKTKEIMFFSLLGLLLIIISSMLIVPEYSAAGTASIKTGLYVLMCIGSFYLTKKTNVYRTYILHTFFTGAGLLAIVLLLNKTGYFS